MRASSRRGRDVVRLDFVDQNGRFCRRLKDIVGHGDAPRKGAPAPDHSANDPNEAVGRVFEAQEETARRIAQSLHDEASQMLAIVYLELANIARNSPQPTAERIDRVIKHLDSVSEQIRGLSHELHPMVLEKHGLMPALKQLARGVGKRSGLDVRVLGEVPKLSPVVEAAIYRVAQEALSNVVRHAKAGRAEIKLWKTKDRVHCSIKDDGVGYRPAKSDEGYGGGLGLVGICERVDSLGGECHLLSGDRTGMELKLGIPL